VDDNLLPDAMEKSAVLFVRWDGGDVGQDVDWRAAVAVDDA
jgi:hypothetical protein